MTTVNRQLAEWSHQLRYEDLPADVVACAKLFLYDSIGCALGGYQGDDVKMATAVVDDAGGNPQATLIGSGRRVSAIDASFLNSLMIRALDFNDIYWKQDPSHPSDIMPAAMACGELKGRSGRDLILGIVLGHEIEMRLCEAAFPGIREVGWHHATLTAFAAPYVAAKALGLSVEQTINAVGISASHSGTFGSVTAGKLTKMKNTVDPMACRSGVEGALLAEKGYEGPEPIFTGREGLGHCISEEWKWEILTDGLGDSFRILNCSMKGAPVEALIHTPLTVVLALRERHGLHADNVAEIRIKTIARAAEILSDPDKYDPQTKETADHSLPYCVAVAVADGKVTTKSFKSARILDPALRPLLNRIKVEVEPEFEDMFPRLQPCEVIIRTTDGREVSDRMDFPMGDPRNPMTPKQMEDKFDALAEGVLSPAMNARAKAAIDDAENAPTITELMECFSEDR
ncbi:MAG: MmgE/PrpD family protein [Gemmatimonadota bacterium]|nr:MAG: MmgE/PrpD family protein [Gemmatimonadota bacterium]